MYELLHLVARQYSGDNSSSSAQDDDPCGPSPTDRLGLRIGAIFIIMVTSLFGTCFPILSKQQKTLRTLVPPAVFEFAKYFGSGVILATALIHLLEPAADDELGPANLKSAGGCIPDAWGEYPYAFGICLASLYFIFVGEMIAFRIGSKYVEQHVSHVGIVTETPLNRLPSPDAKEMKEELLPGANEAYQDASANNPATAQILGVAILEVGVIFHSLIIGLTLSTSAPDQFTTLFVVIIFHQMFEGLGLGTRLAFLQLGESKQWIKYAGAIIYSMTTPLGMSIGLGVRESFAITGEGAAISAGILDSISAGILLYTATVELIAHEFVFNDYYHKCSWLRLTFVMGCFALGAGIMALLGKWA